MAFYLMAMGEKFVRCLQKRILVMAVENSVVGDYGKERV